MERCPRRWRGAANRRCRGAPVGPAHRSDSCVLTGTPFFTRATRTRFALAATGTPFHSAKRCPRRAGGTGPAAVSDVGTFTERVPVAAMAATGAPSPTWTPFAKGIHVAAAGKRCPRQKVSTSSNHAVAQKRCPRRCRRKGAHVEVTQRRGHLFKRCPRRSRDTTCPRRCLTATWAPFTSAAT